MEFESGACSRWAVAVFVAMSAGAAADATPIEPGTQQIDATVTVTFALA